MRWKSWFPASIGEKRVKTWFAWLPVKINNDCRWLERVSVEFELKMALATRYDRYPYWDKVRFVDNIHVQ